MQFVLKADLTRTSNSMYLWSCTAEYRIHKRTMRIWREYEAGDSDTAIIGGMDDIMEACEHVAKICGSKPCYKGIKALRMYNDAMESYQSWAIA